ncbi:hypothetical protein AAC387_Pa04g2712 [Persea americana]
MAAIGWYGPLIDLSQAASHRGDYVQLLVFVHTCRPIQKYKPSNANEREPPISRTDIHVGDDTRSYFSVSIWNKHMGSMISAGDIVLLQNVKIVKYGDVFGATTVQFSSLLQLVHPYELLASKGMDELLMDCRVGRTTKEKLKKVIEWVQRAGSTLHYLQQTHSYQQKEQLPKNWKSHEQRKSRECISISELSGLTDSCNAIFHACIDDIYLRGFEKEKMFSKRLNMMEDSEIVEDLICTGCKLCSTPIDSGSSVNQNIVPFYCQKSSNYVHAVSFIYRPFLLHVGDQLENVPLLVKNKAAEVLFGNITAETVYTCFQEQQKSRLIPDFVGNLKGAIHPKASDVEVADSVLLSETNVSQQLRNARLAKGKEVRKKPNFHGIWLILVKMLLRKGNNSPLKFEVTVDCGLHEENGRFELVALSMPCYRTNYAPD